MQNSPYAFAAPAMVAESEKEQEAQENQPQPAKEDQETETIYVYHTEEGGIYLSPTLVEEESPQAPIVDAALPETDNRPTTPQQPSYFLHVLFIFLIFLALDNIDSFFAQLSPIATVTITPEIKTISTTATLTAGAKGTDITGRVLPALTLSQEQTVQATEHGHQDATRAVGTLTFYNGSFSSQTVYAGTVYTGSDHVQVSTDQTITIPAATPGNPPQFGEATVSASATIAGVNGNISAGDIRITGSTLQVSNSQFHNGQNARDFPIVSPTDIQNVIDTLTPQLLQSERAALTAQLTANEALLTPVCTPHTLTNHAQGDEAQTVSVTVSETCSALAYNAQQLQSAGVRILTLQRAASLQHFQRIGDVHLAIISQVVNGQRAALTVHLSGTWVYQINEVQLKTLLAGKPRLDALHILASTPGVQSASIDGVSDNQTLPTDAAHIHLLLVVTLF